jgi:hypothetical protein
LQRQPSAPAVAAPEEGGGGSLRARARSGAGAGTRQGKGAAAGNTGWDQFGQVVGNLKYQSRSPGQLQVSYRCRHCKSLITS